MQMKQEKIQEEKERLLNSLVEAESVTYSFLFVKFEFMYLCLCVIIVNYEIFYKKIALLLYHC